MSWLETARPELARSLAAVASLPQASELFRAHLRKRLERETDPRRAETRAHLERAPGGHRFFAEDGKGADGLAGRLLRHAGPFP